MKRIRRLFIVGAVLLLAACGAQGGTQNRAPSADAGPDQTVSPGATVTLDGSGSSDSDGDALSYAWALTERPSGSSAVLARADGVTSTFIADAAGVYSAALTVSDGSEADTDGVNVTVGAAPVAVATSVGTYQFEGQADVGTFLLVVVEDAAATGAVATVTVSGPGGWNNGQPYVFEARVDNDRPANFNTAIGYGELLAVAGEYTFSVAYRGETYAFTKRLDPSLRLPAPANLQASGVSADSVTLGAAAVAGAAWYNGYLEDPFAIEYGPTLPLTLTGLSLSEGETYQAFLAAYTLDLFSASIEEVNRVQVNFSLSGVEVAVPPSAGGP